MTDTPNLFPKRALLSVSDKKNLLTFAQGLTALGIEIISTGGTAQILREAKIPVQEVADVTRFPEMMEGRLKTLHPLIHGGILGKRDYHAAIAKQHGIEWIDLVVINLYPFVNTIKKPAVTEEEAIEQMELLGHTFFIFFNQAAGTINVVYKRHAGGYGVLNPQVG